VSIEITKTKEGRAFLVLIPLLLLHLALISLQVQDPAGELLFRRWMLVASSPFVDVSAVVSRGVTSGWRNYVWLRGARAENERLHESVREFLLKDGSLSHLKEENLRLRGLLDLGATVPVKSIGAHVVGRAPSFLSNLMIIDRGSFDGIRTDAAVVSGSGVLGRTVVVSIHHAQVQLITNPDASIGVMLEKSRTPGVLKGTGAPRLELHYLSNSEPVEIGDRIVTSGLDGIFPKDLPVGRVVDSRKGKSVFRVIEVEPLADLVHIEEVLVFLSASAPGIPASGPHPPGDEGQVN
jgi:rod shape-determining protein MreC